MHKRPTTSVPATYVVRVAGKRNFTTRNARNAARYTVSQRLKGLSPKIFKNGNPIKARVGNDGPAMAALGDELRAA